MRTIIAGSRTVFDFRQVVIAVRKAPWTITTILSGGASGADELGEKFARRNKIPLETYPADWNRWGKSAGYRRNAEMADNAEALIALWDGKSKGTANMIDLAKRKHLKVYVHYL